MSEFEKTDLDPDERKSESDLAHLVQERRTAREDEKASNTDFATVAAESGAELVDKATEAVKTSLQGYFSEINVGQVSQHLVTLVKRYPVPSLFAAVALVFIFRNLPSEKV